MQRRQLDKSKHWILDSLEQGSISVPEAAALYNCSSTTIKKYLQTVEEGEMSQTWDDSDMLKAVGAVKDGKMRPKAASSFYNVPITVLKSFVRGRDEPKREGTGRIMSNKEENELSDWLVKKSDEGQKVSSKEIFYAVKAILVKSGKSYLPWEKRNYPDNTFTKSWLHLFLRRHRRLIPIMKSVRKRVRRTKKELETLKEEKNENERIRDDTAVVSTTLNGEGKEGGSIEDDPITISTTPKTKPPRYATRKSIASPTMSDVKKCQQKTEAKPSPISRQQVVNSQQKSTTSDPEAEESKVVTALNLAEDSGLESVASDQKEVNIKSSVEGSVQEYINTNDSEEELCTNCGGFNDPEGSSLGVWISCGDADDDGALMDGCGSWFHIKCTDFKGLYIFR